MAQINSSLNSSYLLNDVTPWTVSLADVSATIFQALIQGVTVQLADVTRTHVLLVLLTIQLSVGRWCAAADDDSCRRCHDRFCRGND